jgi:hypothetical protein
MRTFMTWQAVVRIAYATPIVLAPPVAFSPGIWCQTRHIGSFPVRIEGFELIVWRHSRRWVDVDFSRIVQFLLILDFWAMVIWLIVFLIMRAAMRREQQRRGFEVLLLRSEHTERPGR